MISQPVPAVTRADVERVIRRDYPADEQAKALAILDEYVSDWGEPHRVHLAALKLARGDLAELGQHISLARLDYRDVLAPAEYPLASRRWSKMKSMSSEERQAIYDDDWREYQRWLTSGEPER